MRFDFYRMALYGMLVFGGSLRSMAQVKIGGEGVPNPAAVLELVGNNKKGLLMPLLNQQDMMGIPNPPKGLMIFNTTDSSIYIRREKAWVRLETYNEPIWQRYDFGDVYNTPFNGQKRDVGINIDGPPIASLQVGKSGYPDEPSLMVNGNSILSDSLAIGNGTVVAPLSVGSRGKFRVDDGGNITRLNNIATSFPTNQGSAGSVLLNDGAGNLSWGTNNYQTMINYSTPGTFTWNVPAGITTIKIEIWSGGGSGSPFDELVSTVTNGNLKQTTYNRSCGGGGGAFATGLVAVTPGTIFTIIVPNGGQDNQAKITTPSSGQIILNNGYDAFKAATPVYLRGSGGYLSSQTGIFTNCIWWSGSNGKPNEREESLASYAAGGNTTTSKSFSYTHYGDGGSSPFTNNGGRGGYTRNETTSNSGDPSIDVVVQQTSGTNPSFPGGGSSGNGGPGAGGRIVIYY
jgi:hypothetical protein